MTEQLRIGLIGCGAIGQVHEGIWRQAGTAQVTAVCDPVPARAAEVAERCGARAFTSIDEMLESGIIDAVDVCTPSGQHGEHGLAAARHGLHVICEKPLDLSAKRATELVTECENRGLTLACVFQRRTYLGACEVARAVHAGEFGKLLSCSAHVKWWRAQDYYDSGAWRGTRALDGGVLANQAIHAIDHICWLAGPVVEVEYAHLSTAAHRMESEDLAFVVVRFASGARGAIEATTCCNPPLCSRVEVVGSQGSAAFDDADVVSYGVEGVDRMDRIPRTTEHATGSADPMAISLKGHTRILMDFAEAVVSHRKPLITGRDALMAVDALDRIYRKAYEDC